MTDANANPNQDAASLSRVEKRKIRTREKLIEAMYRLTSEHGADAVTIQNIVDEADIAKGSFYNFYESKEDLLDDVIKHVVQQQGDFIDSVILDFDDPVRVIATAFLTFDKILVSDPILGGFAVNMNQQRPELFATLRDRLYRDVNKGIEQGFFSVPNLTIVADLISSSLWTFYGARLRGEAKFDDVVDFLTYMFRMLGARDEVSLPVIREVCEVMVDKD